LLIKSNTENLILGEALIINCTTDLAVTTIEWLNEDHEVLNYSNKSSQLYLVIDRITTADHNSEYTCRVVSPFGNQTKSTTLLISAQKSSANAATIGGAIVAVLLILLLVVVGVVLTLFAARRYCIATTNHF
jgi:hypothetical protein